MKINGPRGICATTVITMIASEAYRKCLSKEVIVRPIGNYLVLVPRLTLSRADIGRLPLITSGNIDGSNVTTTENGAPFILDYH